MKHINIKSLLYNLLWLCLFFCGMYFFLWRFSGAFVSALTYGDPFIGSDYWLDHPLAAYSGFILTYIIYWLLFVLGRKLSLVSDRMVRVCFVLDILIFMCGTGFGYFVLLMFIILFPSMATEGGIFENAVVILDLYLYILPQIVICNTLFFFRIIFTDKTLKNPHYSLQKIEKMIIPFQTLCIFVPLVCINLSAMLNFAPWITAIMCIITIGLFVCLFLLDKAGNKVQKTDEQG